MLKFNGRIVQFGFGAVGKSFYEKVRKEIKFDDKNYFVLTKDKYEFEAFMNMGGLVSNYIVSEITKDNFKDIFSLYLKEGDLLIDFADTVGTKDICDFCAENNIMYINTGETDWPDNWYSIFNENLLKRDLKEKYSHKLTNRYPIVFHHGNNPGLVSHFTKAAIEYIVKTQFKKNKKLLKLLKENKFNEIAYFLGLKMVQVNDIDLQEVKDKYDSETLYSTWCIDSFFFELLSEATMDIGTHENIDYEDKCNFVDYEHGFLEFKDIASQVKCRAYYPDGYFEGFVVPHEETITIASNLEVKENDKVIYRPSTIFVYKPCKYAEQYLKDNKVNNYPVPDKDKPADIETEDLTIIRGYKYPKKAQIIYPENIIKGTEYVGVLLIGDKFKPVWVGNRIEPKFLYKNKKDSYWQTPTITPVSMSALAAVCWMIKNKDKGGIYFPDDIKDYKYIIKRAEKYISKTIYKTFDSSDIESKLKIDLQNIQIKDLLIKEKEW